MRQTLKMQVNRCLLFFLSFFLAFFFFSFDFVPCEEFVVTFAYHL